MTTWTDEPESFDFTDDATGLQCAMRRGPSGAWCGYVAIPTEHPFYGKGYSDAVSVPEGYMDRPVKVDALQQIGAGTARGPVIDCHPVTVEPRVLAEK